MTELVTNAFLYFDPAHGMIDPVSGYPYEGWNDAPERGLFLRDFTQITAIGQWIELLANIAAGQAQNPVISPQTALVQLKQTVATLRRDQVDPGLSARGLLVNFLAIEGERRLGPLTQSVQRQEFDAAFGDQADAIWQALVEAKWLKLQNEGQEGVVMRGEHFGSEQFAGPLTPYADSAMIGRIMEILDRRVVLVAYGDNANLSTSVAKASGALIQVAEARELRKSLDAFLDAQAEGYRSLIDQEAGMFSFGRDETTGRFFGWNDEDGEWVVGHQDYLVNEFRDPSMFVVARYGLSQDLLKNLGFKIRSYECQDGRTLFTLAPYEGSAFQSFGLDIGMPVLDHPTWRTILENAVDIHLDYASRHKLPGLLTEAYSGQGTDYTGRLGVPELAVSAETRITTAPSLYSLGTASQIAPAKVDAFLEADWARISSLFTAHGPWEGYSIETNTAIEFQTTAHTLSLILGALGTGAENMSRYLKTHTLTDAVDALFHVGRPIDLLAAPVEVISWASDGAATTTNRDGKSLQVRSETADIAGIVFVLPEGLTASLAGGVLELRYEASSPVERVLIQPKGAQPLPPIVIPIEVQTGFKATTEPEVMRIPLPPVASLTGIVKVELNFYGQGKAKPVDFLLHKAAFEPAR